MVQGSAEAPVLGILANLGAGKLQQMETTLASTLIAKNSR